MLRSSHASADRGPAGWRPWIRGDRRDPGLRLPRRPDARRPRLWERGDDVRIVLVFERWDGMSSGAAWEDLKVGMKNLTKWKRIALVTDLDWMITMASLFGWMTPGDLKRFPVAEREQAIAWAAGDG
jgi:hypothetical protein